MDESTVRALGFLLAEQARTFGMVAENEIRAARGDSPAYGEAEFFAHAQQIENIARGI